MVAGLPRLTRQLAGWIGTSVFADIEPAAGGIRDGTAKATKAIAS